MSDSVNVISDEMSKLVYDATDAAINWACAVERDIDVDSKALAAMQAQKILVQAIAKLEAENAALKAKLNAGETVDEWGKPDWVGKEVTK